jgi:hypothetical protein
MRQGGKREIQ